MASTTRIIATRPTLQNRAWCERIESAGLDAVSWPLLDIFPVEGHAAARLKQRILDLADYHSLIFVSQNAVHYGFMLLEQYWPQLPLQLEYFAVGETTARQVEKKLVHLGCHTKVIFAEGSMNSEALLALPQLQHVNDKKILICRGVGGRPTIAQTLRQRNAQVDHAELYTRRMPENAANALDAVALDSDRDVLTFFSGETMDNALVLFKKKQVPNYHSIPVLVPGERVGLMAKKAGFETVLIAKNASADAMWERLTQFFH